MALYAPSQLGDVTVIRAENRDSLLLEKLA